MRTNIFNSTTRSIRGRIASSLRQAESELNSIERARQSALFAICDPRPRDLEYLWNLSQREWKQLLRWLDTSGLALYFLDRMMELNHPLPDAVLSRLLRNLADNSMRMAELIDESIFFHREFQAEDLCYATVKGFSLEPLSVPRIELRSQLDLDFLIAEASAEQAKRVLERRGYQLKAVSGHTWEFVAIGRSAASLGDLYKPGFGRSVELHLEPENEEAHRRSSGLLLRREWRDFHGVQMPVLSPVDIFLGQGLHLFKHICSEFARTAHMLEYRRHILAREHDQSFWNAARDVALRQSNVALRLGVVTCLVSQVTAFEPPEALTDWTVNTVPNTARHWINRYGIRAALVTFPGTKLYILLQQALEPAGLPAKRSLGASLVPRRLPPAISDATTDETLVAKFRRDARQLRFILFRFRFHVLEGLRFLFESLRWRRDLRGDAQ